MKAMRAMTAPIQRFMAEIIDRRPIFV
jgi:hypothetical protein